MGRVEGLRHADERHVVPIEGFHDAGEVQQRPAQAVDLVDHHAVDLSGLDVGHQPLQCRPVHVAAGEAAVVVAVGEALPAFVLLTLMYASPDSRWASSELNS